MIRVGPAGWSYPDWEGPVYPRGRKQDFHPLRFLARFVECLEINSTFYAVPPIAMVEGWNRALAGFPDFVLTAKLHRDFTHESAFAQVELEAKARAFREALEPLKRSKRLTALLVQFPHSFHHSPHEVRRLGQLHALFADVPLVLEVRHASWFAPPALSAVRGLGYSMAYIDLPSAWDHPPERFEATGPLGYLRLHGRNRKAWFDAKADRDSKYDYLYSQSEIAEMAARARRIASEHEETYVVTNNHFAGKAVVNALELIASLRNRPVAAPPELVRAYPRLRASTRTEGQQELF